MAETTQLVLTKRFGKLDPAFDVTAYQGLEGYGGLTKAVQQDPVAIMADISASKLLGRGGMAGSVGEKWQQVAKAKGDTKYIVCNANEGEPGTFKDKALLAQDPLAVIEGMTIAAWTLKVNQGYIYVQGRYPELIATIEAALQQARLAHYLGQEILGIPDFNFDIEVIAGGGAYVCGETSALLNALAGQPGRPDSKPADPTKTGLFGAPTLINNVESFANIPVILRLGSAAFLALGTPEAGGTKLVCLTGQIKHLGLFEVPLGLPLTDILNGAEYGGGALNGHQLKFVHFGGQAGAIAAATDLDELTYSYEALQAKNLTIGSGAIVVMDERTSIIDYLTSVAQFFMTESCGKCIACRLGTLRIYEMLQRFQQHAGVPGDLTYFEHMVDHVADQSICPVGQSIGNPIFSAMQQFPEEFKKTINWQAQPKEEVPW
ncbi:MAG: NADH-quinone oxidoreductase subunit F [Lactobacillus sp.]|jgi:NADH-quinone oxidoreductase subunit F|nr:NADH-quinone oxidoreductase subunit F [Lactobacillus sp.]